MTDNSHLDSKYFIDRHVYNCPFCNRRNLNYYVRGSFLFDWTKNKKCFGYIIECSSCNNKSMHLSFQDISLYGGERKADAAAYIFGSDDLDNSFFYSVPTSFFVLDSRIPRVLRKLMSEAEGCLKSNFLTGASVCARKIVYELGVLQKGTGDNYEERIKSLKVINPNVEPTYFDTLLTIQQVTSTKVHEQSYDGWEAKHLRLILSSLAEVLREIYVVPAIREEKRKAILDLKNEVLGIKPEESTDRVKRIVPSETTVMKAEIPLERIPKRTVSDKKE
jgi:hypothetical protein